MKKLLLTNCNILDGTLDMQVQENKEILIINNVIKEIGTNLNKEKAKVINLNGAYVIPGLINLHVHLPASGKIGNKKVADQKKLVALISSNHLMKKIGEKICANYAKMEVLSGVTTVRAVGGVADIDSMLRDDINKGKVIGPRILSCNNAIGVIGGHMYGTVALGATTNEEAVALVQKQKDTGADLIKLMITGGILDTKERGNPGVLRMEPEMVKACCDKAHELGLIVAAHVEGPDGMRVAIENGVDSIEHTATVEDKYLKSFKKRNGALVCTLSPAMPLAKMRPEVTGYSEDVQYNSNVFLNSMINSINNGLKLGIKVGLGTDTGCPYVTHYDMWRELVYFTKYIDNVSNNFALHTATEVNAEIARIDDKVGTIKEGKLADLMIIIDNPLKDLSALRNPLMVISNGRIIKGKIKKYPEVEQRLDQLMNI